MAARITCHHDRCNISPMVLHHPVHGASMPVAYVAVLRDSRRKHEIYGLRASMRVWHMVARPKGAKCRKNRWSNKTSNRSIH